jgi:hypothetical protein
MKFHLVALALLINGAAATIVQQADAPGDVEGFMVSNDSLDLLEASAYIDGASVHFIWNVTSLEPNPHWYPLEAEFWMEFSYSSETFRTVVTVRADGLEETPFPASRLGLGSVTLYREASPWEPLAEGELDIDVAKSSIKASINRDQIKTSDGFSPGSGGWLEIQHASAYWDDDTGSIHETDSTARQVSQDSVQFQNGMLPFGLAPIDGLTAATNQAIRFSNGEATTYHWPIKITNLDLDNKVIRILAETGPGVEVKMPVAVDVPGNGQVVFNVYASVPFRHEHGGQIRIPLELMDGQNVLSFPLTVQYLEIPQPSGHHPELWIHTDVGNKAWMNAEAPVDESELIEPRASSCGQASGVGWFIPLEPQLLLGLDGRLEETATASVPFQVRGALAEGAFYADLQLYNVKDQKLTLKLPFEGEKSPIGFTPSGTSFTLDFSMDLPESMDLLEPTVSANLMLRVGYCPTPPTDTVFIVQNLAEIVLDLDTVMLPGGNLLLPLNEYRDLLFSNENDAYAVTINPLYAAPGTRVVWEIQGTSEPASILLVGGSSFQAEHLGYAGGSAYVAATIPKDSAQGDLVDFLVEIKADSEQTVRLLAVSDADAKASFDDLLSQFASSEEAPAPVSLVLVMLLVWGWRTRL